METTKQPLIKAVEKLRPYSQSAALDAQVLMEFVLNKPKEYIFTYPEKKLTVAQAKKYQAYVARRAKHEPVAYIVGVREFCGLLFQVNRSTLIPRPETEMIVENAVGTIKHITETSDGNILLIDVGTGSSCIPVAIMKHLPALTSKRVHAIATELSLPACKIARKNIAAFGLNKTIDLQHGNLLEPCLETLSGTSHLLITANLPYLPTAVYRTCPPDVKKYEPKSALWGGKDGLRYYYQLLAQIKTLVNKYHSHSLHVWCEIDPTQTRPIRQLIAKLLPTAAIELQMDLCGKNRVVHFSC